MKEITEYSGLITSQYRRSDKFLAWLQRPLEILHDVDILTRDMPSYFEIDTAVGAQLDILGSMLGQSRNLGFNPTDGSDPSLPDEIYRSILKFKIVVNMWDGQLDSIYEIWNILFADVPLSIYDNQDMTCTVNISGSMPQIVLDMIDRDMLLPRPEGVQYIYDTIPEILLLFAYDADPADIYYAGYDFGYWDVSLIGTEQGSPTLDGGTALYAPTLIVDGNYGTYGTLVNQISMILDFSKVKGLWVFDSTGSSQAVTDLSVNNHDLALRDDSLSLIDASTCSPGFTGYAAYLTFDATHLWDTLDHNDFSFVEPDIFSIVALMNFTTLADVAKGIFVKMKTTGNNLEYSFGVNSAGNLAALACKYSSETDYIVAYSSALISADAGAFHTYGMISQGLITSNTFRLYRDGINLTPIHGSLGSYTTMINGTAKPASYYDRGSGPEEYANAKYSVILIYNGVLTSSQMRDLDKLLRSFANVYPV